MDFITCSIRLNSGEEEIVDWSLGLMMVYHCRTCDYANGPGVAESGFPIVSENKMPKINQHVLYFENTPPHVFEDMKYRLFTQLKEIIKRDEPWERILVGLAIISLREKFEKVEKKTHEKG